METKENKIQEIIERIEDGINNINSNEDWLTIYNFKLNFIATPSEM